MEIFTLLIFYLQSLTFASLKINSILSILKDIYIPLPYFPCENSVTKVFSVQNKEIVYYKNFNATLDETYKIFLNDMIETLYIQSICKDNEIIHGEYLKDFGFSSSSLTGKLFTIPLLSSEKTKFTAYSSKPVNLYMITSSGNIFPLLRASKTIYANIFQFYDSCTCELTFLDKQSFHFFSIAGSMEYQTSIGFKCIFNIQSFIAFYDSNLFLNEATQKYRVFFTIKNSKVQSNSIIIYNFQLHGSLSNQHIEFSAVNPHSVIYGTGNGMQTDYFFYLTSQNRNSMHDSIYITLSKHGFSYTTQAFYSKMTKKFIFTLSDALVKNALIISSESDLSISYSLNRLDFTSANLKIRVMRYTNEKSTLVTFNDMNNQIAIATSELNKSSPLQTFFLKAESHNEMFPCKKENEKNILMCKYPISGKFIINRFSLYEAFDSPSTVFANILLSRHFPSKDPKIVSSVRYILGSSFLYRSTLIRLSSEYNWLNFRFVHVNSNIQYPANWIISSTSSNILLFFPHEKALGTLSDSIIPSQGLNGELILEPEILTNFIFDIPSTRNTLLINNYRENSIVNLERDDNLLLFTNKDDSLNKILMEMDFRTSMKIYKDIETVSNEICNIEYFLNGVSTVLIIPEELDDRIECTKIEVEFNFKMGYYKLSTVIYFPNRVFKNKEKYVIIKGDMTYYIASELNQFEVLEYPYSFYNELGKNYLYPFHIIKYFSKPISDLMITNKEYKKKPELASFNYPIYFNSSFHQSFKDIQLHSNFNFDFNFSHSSSPSTIADIPFCLFTPASFKLIFPKTANRYMHYSITLSHNCTHQDIVNSIEESLEIYMKNGNQEILGKAVQCIEKTKTISSIQCHILIEHYRVAQSYPQYYLFSRQNGIEVELAYVNSLKIDNTIFFGRFSKKLKEGEDTIEYSVQAISNKDVVSLPVRYFIKSAAFNSDFYTLSAGELIGGSLHFQASFIFLLKSENISFSIVNSFNYTEFDFIDRIVLNSPTNSTSYEDSSIHHLLTYSVITRANIPCYFGDIISDYSSSFKNNSHVTLVASNHRIEFNVTTTQIITEVEHSYSHIRLGDCVIKRIMEDDYAIICTVESDIDMPVLDIINQNVKVQYNSIPYDINEPILVKKVLNNMIQMNIHVSLCDQFVKQGDFISVQLYDIKKTLSIPMVLHITTQNMSTLPERSPRNELITILMNELSEIHLKYSPMAIPVILNKLTMPLAIHKEETNISPGEGYENTSLQYHINMKLDVIKYISLDFAQQENEANEGYTNIQNHVFDPKTYPLLSNRIDYYAAFKRNLTLESFTQLKTLTAAPSLHMIQSCVSNNIFSSPVTQEPIEKPTIDEKSDMTLENVIHIFEHDKFTVSKSHVNIDLYINEIEIFSFESTFDQLLKIDNVRIILFDDNETIHKVIGEYFYRGAGFNTILFYLTQKCVSPGIYTLGFLLENKSEKKKFSIGRFEIVSNIITASNVMESVGWMIVKNYNGVSIIDPYFPQTDSYQIKSDRHALFSNINSFSFWFTDFNNNTIDPQIDGIVYCNFIYMNQKISIKSIRNQVYSYSCAVDPYYIQNNYFHMFFTMKLTDVPYKEFLISSDLKIAGLQIDTNSNLNISPLDEQWKYLIAFSHGNVIYFKFLLHIEIYLQPECGFYNTSGDVIKRTIAEIVEDREQRILYCQIEGIEVSSMNSLGVGISITGIQIHPSVFVYYLIHAIPVISSMDKAVISKSSFKGSTTLTMYGSFIQTDEIVLIILTTGYEFTFKCALLNLGLLTCQINYDKLTVGEYSVSLKFISEDYFIYEAHYTSGLLSVIDEVIVMSVYPPIITDDNQAYSVDIESNLNIFQITHIPIECSTFYTPDHIITSHPSIKDNKITCNFSCSNIYNNIPSNIRFYPWFMLIIGSSIEKKISLQCQPAVILKKILTSPVISDQYSDYLSRLFGNVYENYLTNVIVQGSNFPITDCNAIIRSLSSPFEIKFILHNCVVLSQEFLKIKLILGLQSSYSVEIGFYKNKITSSNVIALTVWNRLQLSSQVGNRVAPVIVYSNSIISFEIGNYNASVKYYCVLNDMYEIMAYASANNSVINCSIERYLGILPRDNNTICLYDKYYYSDVPGNIYLFCKDVVIFANKIHIESYTPKISLTNSGSSLQVTSLSLKDLILVKESMGDDYFLCEFKGDEYIDIDMNIISSSDHFSCTGDKLSNTCSCLLPIFPVQGNFRISIVSAKDSSNLSIPIGYIKTYINPTISSLSKQYLISTHEEQSISLIGTHFQLVQGSGCSLETNLNSYILPRAFLVDPGYFTCIVDVSFKLNEEFAYISYILDYLHQPSAVLRYPLQIMIVHGPIVSRVPIVIEIMTMTLPITGFYFNIRVVYSILINETLRYECEYISIVQINCALTDHKVIFMGEHFLKARILMMGHDDESTANVTIAVIRIPKISNTSSSIISTNGGIRVYCDFDENEIENLTNILKLKQVLYVFFLNTNVQALFNYDSETKSYYFLTPLFPPLSAFSIQPLYIYHTDAHLVINEYHEGIFSLVVQNLNAVSLVNTSKIKELFGYGNISLLIQVGNLYRNDQEIFFLLKNRDNDNIHYRSTGYASSDGFSFQVTFAITSLNFSPGVYCIGIGINSKESIVNCNTDTVNIYVHPHISSYFLWNLNTEASQMELSGTNFPVGSQEMSCVDFHGENEIMQYESMSVTSTDVKCRFRNVKEISTYHTDDRLLANVFGFKYGAYNIFRMDQLRVDYAVIYKVLITSIDPRVLFYSSNTVITFYPGQDLSKLNIYTVLYYLLTPFPKIQSDTPCKQHSLTQLICSLPSLASFGHYTLDLILDTGFVLTSAAYTNILVLDKPNITQMDDLSFPDLNNPYIQIKFDRAFTSYGTPTNITCKIKVIKNSIENYLYHYHQQLNGIMYDPFTIICEKDDRIITGDIICIDISFNSFHDYISTCGRENILISRYVKISDYFPKMIVSRHITTRFLHVQLVVNTLSTMNANVLVASLSPGFQCMFEEINISKRNIVLITSASLEISSDSLLCEMPSTVTYDLEFSLIVNKMIQYPSRLPIQVYPPYSISSVFPNEFSFSGGCVLEVTGNDFFMSGNYNCKFIFPGSITEVHAIYVSPTQITCTTPNTSSLYLSSDIELKGVLMISQMDGVYDETFYENIVTYRDPQIIAISPTYTFLDMEIGLTINGMYFRNKKNLYVKFIYEHETFLKPIFIDSCTLFVYTPRSFPVFDYLRSSNVYPAVVKVFVSNNNLEYTTSYGNLEYYTYPIMFDIQPQIGYQSGGESVKITGNYFSPKITHCIFGNYEVLASVTNIHEISCTTPHVEPNVLKVRIQLRSNNLLIFNRNEVYFTYTKMIFINQFDVSPERSPLIGGVTVNIKGGFNFDMATATAMSVTVYFGNVIGTNLIISSHNLIQVTCPPSMISQKVELVIYRNGMLMHYNKLFFYYYDYKYSNVQINPESGPILGDTLITVTNDSEFISNVLHYCLFIDNSVSPRAITKVSAFLIDKNHIECMTLEHSPGLVQFEISFDGVYSTSVNLKFFYYTMIQIMSFTPNFMSAASNCRITVKAKNVIYSSNLVVRIGNEIIDSIGILDSETIYFNLLSDKFLPGEYNLNISNNRQNFVYFKLYKIFIFDKGAILVNSIVPNLIPFKNTLTSHMNISGSGFSLGNYYQTTLNVKFEGNGETYQFTSQYVNDQTLILDYPQISSTLPIVDYLLTFSYNQCDNFSFYSTVSMYQNLDIIQFLPTFAQSYRSEHITVTANNVINVGTLSCKISNGRNRNELIQGIYIDITHFVCIVPDMPPDNYEIAFSINGIDFIYSSFQKVFPVVKTFRLYTADPKIVSSQYNGSIILKGNNFIDTGYVKCQFSFDHTMTGQLPDQIPEISALTSNTNLLTDGMYISSDLISCEFPGMMMSNYGNIPVNIAVKFSEYSLFTEDAIRIFSYQNPPKGYFISQDMNNKVVKCNHGSSCNSEASYKNIMELKCPPGYYQSKSGKHFCLKCPQGYFCNDFGTIFPRLCSPGKSCENNSNSNSNQLSISEVDCPKGFYCPNIEVVNRMNFGYIFIPSSIKLCPVGTFCNGGVSTGLPIPNDFTTPQFCTLGHLCPLGSSIQLGVGPCPAGHYCPFPKDSGIPCPTRTYCPGRGNIRPLLCRKGTYNDELAQHTCKICPMGFICPIEGMFKPEPCPNGYICDKKGLYLPYNYCKPGSVCLSGMKLEFPEKLCYYTYDGGCDTSNQLYTIITENPNDKLKAILQYDYTFHSNLCCFSGKKIGNFLKLIDEYFANLEDEKYAMMTNQNPLSFKNSPLYQFQKYSDAFSDIKYTGYNLLVAYVSQTTDVIYKDIGIYIDFHLQFFDFVLHSMFYSGDALFTPSPCPRKYFCLEGVATFESVSSWDYTPVLCVTGYYCAGGAKFFTGTGQCTDGYYCAAGTDLPSLQSSSMTAGMSILTGCYPGTFLTGESFALNCLKCPDGYECSHQGTSWPNICKEGFFRTVFDTCTACPKGTYGFEKGQKDSSQCVPCPAGKNCPSTNINSLSEIKECEEGKVCSIGTGLNQAIACPNGYYCPAGTKPSEMYDHTCPAGYICNSSTGETNKMGPKCPADYYCPSGSKFYVTETSRLTKCPMGTGSNGSQGLNDLLQCLPSSNYLLFQLDKNTTVTNSLLKRRMASSRMLQDGSSSTSTSSSSSGSNSTSYSSSDSSNSTDSANSDISAYYDLVDFDLVSLEHSKYSITKTLSEDINTKRKTALSLCPIDPTIGLKNSEERTESFPNINSLKYQRHLFKIPSNSYAVVTFDLRHLSKPSKYFIYGIDWDISFEKAFTLNDQTFIRLEMPELFLNQTNIKSKVHEFIVYTIEEIYLKVEVNIYNGMFSSFYSLFNRSAVIEVVKPDRANLTTTQFFGVVLEYSGLFMMPYNIPAINKTMDQSQELSAKIMKNFISYGSSEMKIQHKLADGINSFQPYSLYWGNSDKIGMPYLPYFSNCKNYGAYMPLWALLEQNQGCDLKSENETIEISDFSFGETAKGDNCTISIDCIYDENVRTQSSLPYWFTAQNDQYLFSITKNPVTLDKLYSVSQLDLAEVKVVNSLPQNSIPGTIQMEIYYFQKSKKEKAIIDIQLTFLNPIDQNSIVDSTPIKYTLKISYQPYSHTKLMVAFALSYTFYLVLYFIEGAIGLVLVLIFFFYHRIMSRIRPRPTFKFTTFFPIILPPVIYGFFIAMIPIIMVIIIIAITISGSLFFSQVSFFPCDENSSGDCTLSLFDYISYLPDSSLKISAIRKARLGTAILACGMYLVYKATILMTPKENTYRKLSYDNNIWNFFLWKEFHIFYVNLFLLVIIVYYTLLSFSSFWSKYIWYFIYSFKVVGSVFENVFEDAIQDQLLIAGIPCLLNILQSMITFGATTLVSFLNSAFIELGSLMVERVYLESIVNFIKMNFSRYLEETKNFIKRVLKYDLELESEKKEEEEDKDESDEAIILSTEEEGKKEEEETKKIENEKIEKKKTVTENQSQSQIEEDSEGKKIEGESSDKLPKGEGLDDQSSDEEKAKKTNKLTNEIEIEKLFDRYKGYASDLLAYFFNTVFYLILWTFYDETQIISNYGIPKTNFIYFYYFVIISVPFNIVNDVIYHNLMEEYSNIPMHDFLDYLHYRYGTRKTTWALNDTRKNIEINFSFRSLEKLCFSSQYYFLKTLYITGMCFCLTGIVTLLLNKFNPFGDIATIPLFFYVYILCKGSEKLFTFLAIKIGIWHIEESAFESKQTAVALQDPGATGKRIFQVKKWDKIKFLKDQEEIIEENLRTERLVLDVTRKQFINANKKWLQNVITEIVTPRTLIANKENIIRILKKRFNEQLLPTINNLVSKRKIDDIHSTITKSQEGLHKALDEIEFNERFHKKKQFEEILHIWKNRANVSMIIESQVKLLIVDCKKPSCEKCGSRYSLRTFCESSFVDVFQKFLKERNCRFEDYDVVEFKRYFSRNAKIVTLCSSCQ